MQTEMLEQGILGTMFQHNYLIADSGLKTEHFSNIVHRALFEAMKHLTAKGQLVDAATLIAAADSPESFGDLNYIFSLENFGNVEKFDSWINQMLEAYQRRMVKQLMHKALEDNWSLEKIVSELGSLELQNESDLRTAYEEAMKIYQMPFEDKPQRKGIKTGIAAYDAATGGLVNKELTIIGARPSIGKTDLLINFIIGTQQKNENVLALFFSLEMGTEELTGRFTCNIGNINRNKLKNPHKDFTEGQKRDWPKVIGEYSQMSINFYDKPGQTVAEMRSKIRKAVRENPSMQAVVFIDYLTLITPADKKAIPHVQVSQISRELKNLAKEFNVPVVCLAQLSRSVEKQQEKRPMLSDLRESGSIEQDADCVALLYRENYYDSTKNDDKTLEINIAKQRAGQTGVIKVDYNRGTGRISDQQR